LEAIDKAVLLKAMEDKDAQVRKAAIRISEQYLKNDDKEVIDKLEELKNDESIEVLTQLVLSLDYSKASAVKGIVNEIVAKNAGRGIFGGIQNTIARNEEIRKYGAKLADLREHDRKMVMNGAKIFQSLCVSCHGPEGVGLPTKTAPALIGKFKLLEYKEGVIKIMLHGLKGPVDGITYPDQMPAMGSNDDEWIASVLNYVRYDLSMKSFPNMHSGYINNFVMIQPGQVKKIREQFAGRKEAWTWREIEEDFRKGKK
jgi:mono/diheme cytochrome c family protein